MSRNLVDHSRLKTMTRLAVSSVLVVAAAMSAGAAGSQAHTAQVPVVQASAPYLPPESSLKLVTDGPVFALTFHDNRNLVRTMAMAVATERDIEARAQSAKRFFASGFDEAVAMSEERTAAHDALIEHTLAKYAEDEYPHTVKAARVAKYGMPDEKWDFAHSGLEEALEKDGHEKGKAAAPQSAVSGFAESEDLETARAYVQHLAEHSNGNRVAEAAKQALAQNTPAVIGHFLEYEWLWSVQNDMQDDMVELAVPSARAAIAAEDAIASAEQLLEEATSAGSADDRNRLVEEARAAVEQARGQAQSGRDAWASYPGLQRANSDLLQEGIDQAKASGLPQWQSAIAKGELVKAELVERGQGAQGLEVLFDRYGAKLDELDQQADDLVSSSD